MTEPERRNRPAAAPLAPKDAPMIDLSGFVILFFLWLAVVLGCSYAVLRGRDRG